MAQFSTQDIRSLALVGHAGSGKTTLTEALLHRSGTVASAGSVERGNTVSDYDPLEKQHGHSLNETCVHLAHDGTRIHLIDTPGAPDFLGQAISALGAVETAAVVVNAANGIEMITGRMMHWAERRKLCRLIVVNKIDAEGVNLPGLVGDIQKAFGKECLPINLPAQGGQAVVDCFFNPAGDSDFWSVAEVHRMLVDQVVEVDEQLMEVYLEQGEVAPEQLHEPFEAALREGHLIPICFVSARTGAGVAELLDVIARLMPNPLEGNPPLFVKGEGEEAEEFHSEPDPAKHVLAHVFKVAVDPYVGKMGIFRVHQGTVTRDTQLYIGDGRKPFKVGHLFLMQGKDHVEIDSAVPGDICAVSKVDDIHYDAVLHDSHDEDHIHLRPLEFPAPIHGLAISPVRRGDEQRLNEILSKLQAEDPCFIVERTAHTNETVIRGLGELHLRCMLEKMQEHYKMEVETRPPRIAYRETITGRAEGHHRHKKQTGGAGQFGEVFLRVEPLERGTGFEFVDEIKGGVIPAALVAAVEKGVVQVMESGFLAGYPLQDVRVVVYDGKTHPVDSKEVAFITAGRKAFMDALGKARPILLEPIVNMEVSAPEANVGDITGDISSKRGQVTGTDSPRAGTVVITGQIPLAEVSDYQSRLKSVTGGHGSYSLEFSHYQPVPPGIQQQVVAQYRPHEDEQ